MYLSGQARLPTMSKSAFRFLAVLLNLINGAAGAAAAPTAGSGSSASILVRRTGGDGGSSSVGILDLLFILISVDDAAIVVSEVSLGG